METLKWLLGALLWDVTRYLEHAGQTQFFWELYKDVPMLQPSAAAEWQNRDSPHGALREARSLALGFNWQPSGANHVPKALKSIFSSIQLRVPTNPQEQLQARYLCLQPLHEEPDWQATDTLDDEKLKIYLSRFFSELRILRARWESHEKLDTLLPLLEKYFWCLPSWNVSEETDVPLFALAKMSTAIMACWPANDKGQPQVPLSNVEAYTLICGDVSGIQKYIYRISSAKGVAKGLKARSFELAILADAVAKWLLREFKLTTANLIYSSGGKFYILAPAAAKERINDQSEESISYRLAHSFWESYGRELFLGLGAVSLRGEDFMKDKFSDRWREAAEASNRPKQAKFHLLMEKQYTKIFAPPDVGGIEETCDVCQREGNKGKNIKLEKQFEGTPDERIICNICQETEDRGQKLAKANLIAEVVGNHVAGTNGVASISPLDLGITYYIMNESEDCKLEGEAITYWNLNIHDYVDENFKMRALEKENVNCGFRFYGGNRIPRIEGSEKLHNYDTLTEASEGIKRLGVLRMDVDFLGDVFRKGLAPPNTAARVLTLSWHLNYYFCGRLNSLREQMAPDHALIVYSGGDDLFIVGAWNKVLALALAIRDDFKKYTANPQLTISGGMVLVPKKFPIHKSAIMSGQAEDEAKEVDGIIRRLVQAGNQRFSAETATPAEIESLKNGFTFLEKPLRWHDFDIAVSIKDALYAAITEASPPLNKGILTRLRQIYALFETRRRELKNMSRQTQRDLQQHVDLLMYDKWRWRLVYALKRYKDDNEKHEDLINNLQNALINNEWQPLKWEKNGWQKTGKLLKSSAGVQIAGFIDVPTRWVELLTREEIES